ncbi:MAG: NAD(P)-binding domain-containing protein [Acidimicrobiaceae bacterium]|nr:NAD(P)-binding domain-containing protein [Acidimicrobiaceae bacterium]
MMWRLGVIGSPIEHSLSPTLHERGLELAGLAGTSQRHEMDRENANEVRTLMTSQFDALSVTMPLKDLVGSSCDVLDPVSTRTRSVNSLLMREGLLYGASTDGAGLLDALKAQFDFVTENSHVMILGAGGAAAAIVDALVGAGATSVVVRARNPDRVAPIAARYSKVVNPVVTPPAIDLIVNTVPVTGRATGLDVERGVDEHTIAIDVTYEPRMSTWREGYERHGCPSDNGLGMLAYQAARQMNWWWDCAIDGAELLEALR